MQTTKFPMYVCKKIDKLNRNFLWGDTEVKKKAHLVKWDTVCKPKKIGGLGIRKCCDNNVAVNAKLGWEVMTGSNAPWIKLIRNKYGCGMNMRLWARKPNSSHIWKSIHSSKDILATNTKWIVSNGKNINVGSDWWCGKGPIKGSSDTVSGILDDNVSSLITENVAWNTLFISNNFLRYWVDAIHSVPLPLSNDLQDTPTWTEKGTWKFLISNCYNLLFESNENVSSCVNWKLKLPQKIIKFFWLFTYGKILTNEACVNRNISQNPYYDLCGHIESIDHIFRDCHFAVNIWNTLTNDTSWCDRNVSFNDWLELNGKLEEVKFQLNLPWGTIFAATIWTLWTCRNDRIFKGKKSEVVHVASKCRFFAHEIHHAFASRNVKNITNNNELIKWCFPPSGTVKINSDGSTFGEFGWAAYGGLAIDDVGRWIEGFCGRIGYATQLQAELWGIRRAMKLANDRAWLEATVETDSLVAVNLINKDDVANHPDKTLIEDCKKLKEALLLNLVHVRQEGNKCDDYMAKLGRVQGEQAMRVMIPSNELVQLLKADMQGVTYPRGD